MSTKTTISVVILTHNEAIHLTRCIESLLPFVKTIYIIDSYSTDTTLAIAHRYGAVVYQRYWINYADQFQWALDHCPIDTEWVMRIDADEYLGNLLINELGEKLPNLSNEYNGVNFRLNYKFMNRHIRYGDRNLILLRLWRTGMVSIENRWMDEHIILKKGKIITFDNLMFDHNINTVGWFIEKHNKYATREMIEIINQKYSLFGNAINYEYLCLNFQAKLKRWVKQKIYNRLPLFVRPTLYFLYRYLFRLGFLDGKEGFAYHFMQGFWYRCLVDLKVFEAERAIADAQTTEERISRLEGLTGLNLQKHYYKDKV